MSEETSSIRELLERLEALSRQQESFQEEIKQLHSEFIRLQSLKPEPAPESETPEVQEIEDPEIKVPEAEQSDAAMKEAKPTEAVKPHTRAAIRSLLSEESSDAGKPESNAQEKKSEKIKTNLEEFIGGNLINKIGIIIIIIGVGIGVKYAIDHDLISPLMRIVLGYLAGVGLLAFAVRLKKEYLNFSAVLMSGSMAIFYFITYAAHSYFNLIPLWLTFTILVIFTILTILFSLQYNRQVIAHIGLIGAYAVPFIFKETSVQPNIFFSYMALINAGILVLAVLKSWKPLYYTSFLITWLIFFSWFTLYYEGSEHYVLVTVILPVYFITFYAISLVQKLRQHDGIVIDELLVMLCNSLLFFGYGFYVLHNNDATKDLKGLFTLINAAVHGAVGLIIYRSRYPDRKLFYLAMGLVVGFITLAVPVRLDGTWVTMIWAGEAVFLFWLGRTKNRIFYQGLSCGLIYLMTISLFHDWLKRNDFFGSGGLEASIPFMNMVFLASLIGIISYGLIIWLNNNSRFHHETEQFRYRKEMNYIIAGTLIGVLYLAVRLEIGMAFTNWYDNTAIDLSGNDAIPSEFRRGNNNITSIGSLIGIIYSLIFLSILSQLNAEKFKIRDLAVINLILNCFALIIFLTLGLDFAGNLRDNFLDPSINELYTQSAFQILIRYISITAAGVLIYSSYSTIKNLLEIKNLKVPFETMLVITLLVLVSTELIQWIDILGETDSYKLALSILWGLFAVGLIVVGILKNKIHLRISAIVLFTGTLIKLFSYDIRHLDTISKTVVFIILGILLLITSFLYIKYKNRLFDKS